MGPVPSPAGMSSYLPSVVALPSAHSRSSGSSALVTGASRPQCRRIMWQLTILPPTSTRDTSSPTPARRCSSGRPGWRVVPRVKWYRCTPRRCPQADGITLSSRVAYCWLSWFIGQLYSAVSFATAAERPLTPWTRSIESWHRTHLPSSPRSASRLQRLVDAPRIAHRLPSPPVGPHILRVRSAACICIESRLSSASPCSAPAHRITHRRGESPRHTARTKLSPPKPVIAKCLAIDVSDSSSAGWGAYRLSPPVGTWSR